ncbi:DNA/RNA helicase, DEAD/DEAH box type, N-terminal [Cynara cardunculus var. scolymus]|uniref:RNA helicase n=1 Tax=Cynara cardunculus var. scolymus TaxID=59895 RepID=A0A103Y936_CYNCS|nr:DNA/RNA helicase, DEAD/DEAH box type, N-terminal [Cynara cardunculus var. scolymus]
MKKIRKKKMKTFGMDEDEDVGRDKNPNAVSNFRISEPLRIALKTKGIEALFPIQARTFESIYDGLDLIGKAKTGQGKTLAFILPILESLINGPEKASRRTGYGRAPTILVLLPTRELAKQVFTDFKYYGDAVGLTSCCLYGGGGASISPQTVQLKRGVDIVVGAVGRVKDHIERGNLDFSSLKYRILDEADEMLRQGFVEDVEYILGKVNDASKVQTIASQFLKVNKKTVDLVGVEVMKASENVRHIIMPCSSSARCQVIPDIIRHHSSGGRTIVFTETKDYCSELAGVLPGARPLHGDIQQSQREATLGGFRSGKFMTLVATNVAARGLDIHDVQLIIQPRRANISKLEREAGVKFEHVSAPQPSDIAKAAGADAAEAILQVSDSVIPVFKSAAEDLLNTSGLSPGYTEIKQRSLLTSMENYVTVLLEAGRPIYTPSRILPEEKVESVRGLALTADQKSAVFDVSVDDLNTFLAGILSFFNFSSTRFAVIFFQSFGLGFAGQENAGGVSLVVVNALPQLQEREQSRGRFGDGRGGYGNRRGGSGGGGGGGGFSRGGRVGYSDRRNDRFPRGSGGGGRGRGGYKKW